MRRIAAEIQAADLLDAPDRDLSLRDVPRPDATVGTNQRAQIVLTDEEIEQVLAGSRTMTMATIGADGQPHLVAMWFAIIDGDVCFETKAKSQKAVNLRRDPRLRGGQPLLRAGRGACQGAQAIR